MTPRVIQHESGNVWIDLETAQRFNEHCADCSLRQGKETCHTGNLRQQILLTPQQALDLRDKLTEILRLMNYISKPQDRLDLLQELSDYTGTK